MDREYRSADYISAAVRFFLQWLQYYKTVNSETTHGSGEKAKTMCFDRIWVRSRHRKFSNERKIYGLSQNRLYMFHSLSIKLSLFHLDASYHLEATPNLRISDLTLIWREGKVNSMETKVKRGETHVMLATRMRTFSAPLLHNNKSAQILIWGWPTLIHLWERCCHCLVQSRSNWTVAGSWMSSARWKNKVLQPIEGKTCPYELSYLADWKFINFSLHNTQIWSYLRFFFICRLWDWIL